MFNYVDVVLTVGTLMLVSPALIVLGTYTVRGSPRNRLSEEVEQEDCDEGQTQQLS